MSKVICFRLDETNPREAQALAVLNERHQQGHRLRDTLVEALIRLNDNADDHSRSPTDETSRLLAELRHLLNQIQNGGMGQVKNESLDTPSLELSEGFLEAVRKAAKPGLRVSR